MHNGDERVEAAPSIFETPKARRSDGWLDAMIEAVGAFALQRHGPVAGVRVDQRIELGHAKQELQRLRDLGDKVPQHAEVDELIKGL